MGFAVVHMTKIGKGGVRGIQSHNQREKPPHTNPDIDKARTPDNYELWGGRKNYNRAINDCISHFATNTKTVRKDAVVLCSFIITSDEQTMKAMPPDEQRAFFEDALSFFCDRYGAELVVNATVHMDEKTPHMHLGLVPITSAGRLSAKAIFNKTELQNLQTDFAREVGQKYGLERGIEGSERKHLSEQRFKMEQAIQREKAALETVSKAAESVQKAQKAFEGISDRLIPLKAEYEAKKAYVDQAAKASELSMMYPEYAKVTEKGLVKKEKYVTVPAERWEEKHVSANEVSAVLKMRAVLEEQIAMLKKTKSAQTARELKSRVDSLESDNRLLHSQLTTAKTELQKYQRFMERHPDVDKAFRAEQPKRYQPSHEQQRQERHQDFDMER